MTRPFPSPPNNPFERLQPSDGMLITASHWKKQENYHRRHQKENYQSLNQPGIVNGLGVRAVAAPKEVSAAYRDQRWVQIQPGRAIDLAGNVIVVPKPLNFRIATELKDSKPVKVYLVARYRDPDELEDRKTSEIVQETYRIDEKSTAPDPSVGDVELCQILLQINKNAITEPTDVFFPGYGDINLCERLQAKACPEGLVRVAQINRSDDPESSRNFYNLCYLVKVVERYCPSLRGVKDIEQVDWAANLQSYDLLYLTGQQKLSLNAVEVTALKSCLHSGGTLLVDVPSEATELIESVQFLAAKQLKSPLKPLEQLRPDHPLRNEPCLFDALPLINQQTIQLLCGGDGGLVLAIGDLASAWGLERGLNLPRGTIRDAQELGVNILHYAWKRRQLSNLYKEN
ncbi:MAG: hypothetical protein CLLPBCKN_006879 [Chroococcidiopsis cubana SAG 39.79]|uniref:DUF4159 domain-containing protein n=1 Tax=Chroococcidiopsis cubana SAG 39.79 TaxID=388085 RepID=A0AB37UIL9_9CYAN|nr:DUF4159 domain-containing protein [Chroococcidiopsis cubana]MDZ4877444.1 hypothetical protein [Chroococcidiopsis cubana SAG 39.79]PSB65832.1 hypothetical protein C7B79_03705 [Chroococcidiopsis cubana CCALA 043]RUT11218.1 hypothetical protein DSM107010_34870 [Chroococcidiopsis cubana SAG 39.79]